MTTEQIDNYLSYIQATEEAYKLQRNGPFKYSESQEEQEEENQPEDNSVS